MLNFLIIKKVHKAKTVIGKDVVKAKDIFSDIWEDLSHGERRSLGKDFYGSVSNRTITSVSVDHKDSNDHAYYR